MLKYANFMQLGSLLLVGSLLKMVERVDADVAAAVVISAYSMLFDDSDSSDTSNNDEPCEAVPQRLLAFVNYEKKFNQELNVVATKQ